MTAHRPIPPAALQPSLAVTSLEDVETTQQLLIPEGLGPGDPALDSDQSFRHSGWLRDRKRVHEALRELDPNSNRLARFADCGSNAWVMYHPEKPGQYRVAANQCRDRFCLPCAKQRGRTIANSILTHLQDRQFRFITLTIRTQGLSLRDSIKKLYQSFSKLKTRAPWKGAVAGGVAICEIKYANDRRRWHPHLHILAEGGYMPQRSLSAAWHKCTGDSFICDIRLGADATAAARYVTKYVAKPLSSDVLRSVVALPEAVRALKGRRLCLTFGTWKGVQLTDTPSPEGWITIAPLATLRQQAAAGEPAATSILASLLGELPCQPVKTHPP